MVAVGATLSAFWIIVANSWQQTPAGFEIRNGRAELTGFADAVFNASTWPRFFHTFDACLIAGAFLVAGVSAYLVLKNNGAEVARKSLKLSVIFGLIVSVLALFPTGDARSLRNLRRWKGWSTARLALRLRCSAYPRRNHRGWISRSAFPSC
jgi:cytochrome d ubiquinol oxidase subunit I